MRKWRTCPQNGNYKISSDGLCRSTHPRFEGKFLTPTTSTRFAPYYVLCSKYYKKAWPIRHLVYTAFVGEVPKGYIVFNKDGNTNNNNVENLDMMPLADKMFYYCKYRTKKAPKMTDKHKYTFMIDGVAYNTSQDVIKKYPQIGTRQNLCFQADRWIRGKTPRGKKWEPSGFIIQGIRIWATKNTVPNPTKKRMDKIKESHNL